MTSPLSVSRRSADIAGPVVLNRDEAAAPRRLNARALLAIGGLTVTGLFLFGVATASFFDHDPLETGSITGAPSAPVAGEADGAPTAKAEGSAQLVTAPLPARPARIDAGAGAAPSSEAQPTPAVTAKPAVIVSNERLAGGTRGRAVPSGDAEHLASLEAKIGVVVAETEAEVASLEEAHRLEGQPKVERETEVTRLELGGALSNDSVREDVAAPQIPLPQLKAARLTRYVNLREGPADESRVIAVLPTDADVDAEGDCGWCLVVYDGQRGYIYKSFIRYK